MLFCFSSPGFCAHEFIVDAKDFKKYGIEAIDIAKRLQDYGERKCLMPFARKDLTGNRRRTTYSGAGGGGELVACFNCGQT